MLIVQIYLNPFCSDTLYLPKRGEPSPLNVFMQTIFIWSVLHRPRRAVLKHRGRVLSFDRFTSQNRTGYPLIMSQLLYRMSYSDNGFEPYARRRFPGHLILKNRYTVVHWTPCQAGIQNPLRKSLSHQILCSNRLSDYRNFSVDKRALAYSSTLTFIGLKRATLYCET